MKFTLRANLLCHLLFCATFSSSSQALYPGAKAPELKVGEWVKGSPVTTFADNHVYIVEFWATWCGPCKTAIPHLTSLAKKYEGKVSVIGVSIAERNFKDVAPFVSRMGDKMNYNVAYDYQSSDDPSSGFMSKNWMEAAGLNGIPATFVVGKKGIIEYIGYPDAMLDSALAMIVANKWNAADYDSVWRKRSAKQKGISEEQQKEYQAQQAKWNAHPVKLIIDRIHGAIKEKNYSAAFRMADSLEKMDAAGVPLTPPTVRALDARFEIYAAQENSVKYFETFDKILEIIVADKEMGGYGLVNDIIWKRVIDPNSSLINDKLRDYNFAIKWMKQVVASSDEKDPASLDTLAWAYYGNGDKKQAVVTEEKALSLLAADDPQRGDYEEALKTFQK